MPDFVKVSIKEKENTYNSEYPYNQVKSSSNGIVVEVDDTPQNIRYHIFHPSGTFLELQHLGHLVTKSTGDTDRIVEKNFRSQIKGKSDSHVTGSLTHIVGKAAIWVTEGDKEDLTLKNSVIKVGKTHKTVVGGDAIYQTAKSYKSVAASVDIKAGDNRNGMIESSLPKGTFRASSKNMELSVSNTFRLASQNAIITPKQVKINTSTTELNSGSTTINSGSVTVNCGNMTVNGDFDVNG